MITEAEQLKPYLEAVKAARVARYLALRLAASEDSLTADLVHAENEYQRACEQLACFIDYYIES